MKNALRSVVAGASLVAGSAMAALPTGVDTAITGAGDDVKAAIALMIGVAVGIWAIKKVLGQFGK